MDGTWSVGSAARVRVTALRNAASCTVSLGLEYSTTTSAASRPNVLAARSLSCWLWLPGAVKPPPDCSAPNTPVPHTAAAITTSAAIPSTSRRRA